MQSFFEGLSLWFSQWIMDFIELKFLWRSIEKVLVCVFVHKKFFKWNNNKCGSIDWN